MTRPPTPEALRRWLAAELPAGAGAPGDIALRAAGLRADAGPRPDGDLLTDIGLHSAARHGAAADLLADAGPGADAGLAADTDALDEADAALAALLAGEPLAAPPSGFADRVMARLAHAETPHSPAAARRRWALGLGIPAGVAAAAATMLWLPLLLHALRSLLGASGISRVLQAAIDAAHLVAQVGADLTSWVHTLVLLVTAVAKPLAVPPVAALAALSLIVSAVALRSLHALIQRDRRWVYVDPV